MAAPMTTKMNGGATVITLTDGTAQVLSARGMPLPATVWAKPAAGDTVRVEYSLDNGSNYDNWPPGDVTAADFDTLLSGVTNLRFTRVAGAGTTSTAGVC